MEIFEFIGEIEKAYRWLREEKKRREGEEIHTFLSFIFPQTVSFPNLITKSLSLFIIY